MKEKPNTEKFPINEVESANLARLAGMVNFYTNCRNEQEGVRVMNELFDCCYGNNGHKLLELSLDECQVVGLAFANIALYLWFGDEDMNSVASENAVYCLSRSLIASNNHWCAPAIFSLLFRKPHLLKDQMISTHCAIVQERIGIHISLYLRGNPYTSPLLDDFRQQALNYRFVIMQYLLDKFYDFENQKYLVPDDLPFLLPSKSDINKAKKEIDLYFNGKNITMQKKREIGERYFYTLFEQCEDTLSKF